MHLSKADFPQKLLQKVQSSGSDQVLSLLLNSLSGFNIAKGLALVELQSHTKMASVKDLESRDSVSFFLDIPCPRMQKVKVAEVIFVQVGQIGTSLEVGQV